MFWRPSQIHRMKHKSEEKLGELFFLSYNHPLAISIFLLIKPLSQAIFLWFSQIHCFKIFYSGKFNLLAAMVVWIHSLDKHTRFVRSTFVRLSGKLINFQIRCNTNVQCVMAAICTAITRTFLLRSAQLIRAYNCERVLFILIFNLWCTWSPTIPSGLIS